ncbi:hypothetical protein GQ53DRAFT_819325 [Thozetella sp. PMI_491]|nr:hypothetical protein GQ53DRAFT_819325 [Thozetella sp. PMI_491]
MLFPTSISSLAAIFSLFHLTAGYAIQVDFHKDSTCSDAAFANVGMYRHSPIYVGYPGEVGECGVFGAPSSTKSANVAACWKPDGSKYTWESSCFCNFYNDGGCGTLGGQLVATSYYPQKTCFTNMSTWKTYRCQVKDH